MSNIIVFSNNASGLMASGIAPTDTTVTLQPGQGALFPAITAGQIAVVTFEDTSGNIEIVHATGITSDTLTITRAQEGTTALSFSSGSRVELRVTAGILEALLQKTGGDTLSGTTNLSGILALGGAGSIQGGEFTGALRGAAGVTGNQILVPSNGTSPATQAGSVILTKANIAANVPSGLDFAHTGMIVLWNGSSGSVPTGWAVCDGTSGTPDLRDKFVLGAGGALPASGGSSTTTTGSTDPAIGLSVTPTALTINQIPTHSHTFLANSAMDLGGASGNPAWTIGSGATPMTTAPSGSGVTGQQIIGNAGLGQTHTHAIPSLAHTHSYALPPYTALLYIMKL